MTTMTNLTTNTTNTQDNDVDIFTDTIEEPGRERLNILDGTLCVSVQLTRLGVTRRVSASAVEVDADRNMIKVSKKILDSPQLKAITKIDTRIRQMLNTYAITGSKLFRGGIYCLPAEQAPLVDEKLEEFRQLREDACEEFYAIYEQQRAEAQDSLRALHNPLDYPSLDAVRRAFGMETSYINIGVPQNLEGISKTIFDREREKHATKITEAADEIKLAMRAMLKDLVDHMVERLVPDEDNLDEETGQPKPKKFHASMVEKMGTFLELFESKNVANDVELSALVAKAKSVMLGVDPKSLRSNDDLRSYVVREMSAVKASLDTMVVASGGRRYKDDDENDEEAA